MKEKMDGRKAYIKQRLHDILLEPLTLGSERTAMQLWRMLKAKSPSIRLGITFEQLEMLRAKKPTRRVSQERS